MIGEMLSFPEGRLFHSGTVRVINCSLGEDLSAMLWILTLSYPIGGDGRQVL